MRIAMLGLKGLPGTFGGVERHVEELGAQLTERGHEVVAYVRPFYTPREIVVRGVRTKLLPTIHTKHLDAAVHSFLGALHAGLSAFDVVHFHGIGPGAFSPLTRLLGRPVVTTIHSLNYEHDKWNAAAKRALRLGEDVSVRAAHRVICVSEAMAARHHGGKTPVTHIPNGVGKATPTPPRIITERWGLRGGDYVFFAGRVSPEKGVHHLVRGFKKVRGDWRLIVAGSTQHNEAYVRDLRAAMDQRTLLVDHQEGAALAELFTNAAAFVLPSDHEGMPVALLEAWSYGLPALVSGIGPCREIGGGDFERCHYFEPGDADDLAARLADLLADPRAKAMAACACDHVAANYGWETIAARVEKEYLLAAGGRR